MIGGLVSFYNVLADEGVVPLYGWSNIPIGSELNLKYNGEVKGITNLRTDLKRGKVTVHVPQKIELPSWGDSKSNSIRGNFWYGPSAYMLGMSNRESGTPERNEKSVKAQCKLHHDVLDPAMDTLEGVEKKVALAVLTFLDNLAAGKRLSEELIKQLPSSALTGDNIVFAVENNRIDEFPNIQKAWDAYFQKPRDDEYMGYCSVTGEYTSIARKHPYIRGLFGARSTGAWLSSVNMDSACSYGYKQNENASVSRRAAFAYAEALSYLLDNSKYSCRFGDLTILWWPEDDEDDYLREVSGSLFGAEAVKQLDNPCPPTENKDQKDSNQEAKENKDKNSPWSDYAIGEYMKAMAKGKPIGSLDPNRKFTVLGLSPDAKDSSRIAVRFYMHDTFGNFMKNVMAHYDRLSLAGGKDDKLLTTARAFRAMARENTDELPKPLIEDYFESVLFGRAYPTQMLIRALDRFKKDKDMQWHRVSLIKAYFLQYLKPTDKRKECFTMSLNKENTTPAYLLGRLLAVYEAIQSVGRGNKPYDAAQIHSMFNAAMSTPATVYPRLAHVISCYTSKDECKYYSKLVEQITSMLSRCEYPKRLNLVDQGCFVIGYYHQRQDMFEKKDKSAGESDKKTENNDINEDTQDKEG